MKHSIVPTPASSPTLARPDTPPRFIYTPPAPPVEPVDVSMTFPDRTSPQPVQAAPRPTLPIRVLNIESILALSESRDLPTPPLPPRHHKHKDLSELSNAAAREAITNEERKTIEFHRKRYDDAIRPWREQRQRGKANNAMSL